MNFSCLVVKKAAIFPGRWRNLHRVRIAGLLVAFDEYGSTGVLPMAEIRGLKKMSMSKMTPRLRIESVGVVKNRSLERDEKKICQA